MREDKIRFRTINFDWGSEMVNIRFSVGSQAEGGYQDGVDITFEKFTELIDTKELREYLDHRKLKKLTFKL